MSGGIRAAEAATACDSGIFSVRHPCQRPISLCRVSPTDRQFMESHGCDSPTPQRSATMAYAWQTVELAAVTLGISTRTIARRIAKGELESRLTNGRREVYICAPDSSVETVEGELTGSDA